MKDCSITLGADLAAMLDEAYEGLSRAERATLRSRQDYARRLLCKALDRELDSVEGGRRGA